MRMCQGILARYGWVKGLKEENVHLEDLKTSFCR